MNITLLQRVYSQGFQEVPFEVFSYCAQCIHDDTIVCKIPIANLSKYSTACGIVNNKPFTKRVIQFLRQHSAKDYVVAEVLRGTTEIINMAVCWKDNPEKNSEKFADMVCMNGGSLRPELDILNGWDMYESE